MCHQHPSTAISLASKLVHRVTVRSLCQCLVNAKRKNRFSPITHACVQECHVTFPKVRNDLQSSVSQSDKLKPEKEAYLSTREATHRNDHGGS